MSFVIFVVVVFLWFVSVSVCLVDIDVWDCGSLNFLWILVCFMSYVVLILMLEMVFGLDGGICLL